MKKYTLWEQGDTALTECKDGEYYLASDVDAKFKEYDDDNLALSQSVSKLGARIAELESALEDRYMDGYNDGYSDGAASELTD